MLKKMVLQKFIAQSGFCSRRQAKVLIEKGQVKVNNCIAKLGTRVKKNDIVKINNHRLWLKKKIYIKLNKPVGYTCTNRKFRNEKNIFDLVKYKERLFTVGRLDKNSRGLILLTNDGELAQKLMHPRYKHKKIYIIIVSHPKIKMSQQFINNLIFKFKKGIDIGNNDGIVKVKAMNYLGNNKFKITLTQGKKRQIRRMFKTMGMNIKDLQRIAIGKLQLGKLEEGQWKFINKIKE